MIVEGMIFPVIILIVLSAVILLEIRASRKGKVPKIRELTAMNATDESIGRSVEMGRPVHFSAGVGTDMLRFLSVIQYVYAGGVVGT